jgi:hypothetical protein
MTTGVFIRPVAVDSTLKMDQVEASTRSFAGIMTLGVLAERNPRVFSWAESGRTDKVIFALSGMGFLASMVTLNPGFMLEHGGRRFTTRRLFRVPVGVVRSMAGPGDTIRIPSFGGFTWYIAKANVTGLPLPGWAGLAVKWNVTPVGLAPGMDLTLNSK